MSHVSLPLYLYTLVANKCKVPYICRVRVQALILEVSFDKSPLYLYTLVAYKCKVPYICRARVQALILEVSFDKKVYV